MFCKNKEVNAMNISDGLDAFLNVQSNFQTKVILAGHNIKLYDCYLLLESCNRTNVVSQHVEGFVDTKMLLNIYDGTLKCYTQESLFKHFVSSEYNVHNAQEDVLALQKLIRHLDKDVSACIFFR